MGTLALTNVVAGNSILAADLNNGWTAIKAVVNGDLDETNFASGLIYDPNKLKQSGAATNDTLYWTGSVWDNTPLTTLGRGLVSVVYARSSATVDYTNSTSETDLMTQTITGGHMSTNRMLRLTVMGDIQATSTSTMTPRLKFGGNSLWGDAMSVSNATIGSSRIPWMFHAWIINLNSASVQFSTAQLAVAAPTAGSVAGFGNESGTTLPLVTATASSHRTFGEDVGAAVDVNTASDMTLAFSMQAGTAATTWSVRRHYWVVELV